uniref:Uncharacterized protein n=1 Tax=Anguilla anguilla TaxID=7936 RepID=A0A0E9X786_ANGAN
MSQSLLVIESNGVLEH